MTVSLKHKFQSAKTDGTDNTLIQPSNWNAEHDLTCAGNRMLGRAAAEAGTVQELDAAAVRTLIGAATSSEVTALLGALLPAGVFFPYGGATAPAGYLLCNGQAVSRTTYAALFTAIGTAWGAGDGSTTFNVPNLQGAFLRGAGAGLNATTRAVGSYEDDAFKSHTHTATVTDPGHTHTYTAPADSPLAAGGSGSAFTQNATTASSATGISVTNASTGGSETRPKNFAAHFIIKT